MKSIIFFVISFIISYSILYVPCYAQSGNYPTVKLTGFTHLWWQYDNNADYDVTQKLARARIGITGNMSPKINYLFLTECGDLTLMEPCTLLDAWVNFKLRDSLNIKIGQTWYKFSLSGTEILPKIPFIFRPRVVDHIWLTMGRNGSYAYDKGVEVWGNFKDNNMPWGYIFSVTAGSGLYYFDDNGKQDLAGRIWINPVQGLKIGASAFKGSSSVKITSSLGSTKAVDIPEYAGGVELCYKQSFYRLMAEYLQGYYDNYSSKSALETFSTSSVKPKGMYIMAGFKVHPRLELPVRYDYYEMDSNQQDAGLGTTTIGITWLIKKETLNNVKINYIIKDAQKNYNLNSDDMLAVQIQLMI
ncbi:MAG: hypothetical protein JW871_04060 [Endomicrobiales bacterium]|nr:hypothetical protein [Endomicrobiales bacterium]